MVANDGKDYNGLDQNFTKIIDDFKEVNKTFDDVKNSYGSLLADIKYFQDNAKYEQEQNIEGWLSFIDAIMSIIILFVVIFNCLGNHN